MRWTTSPSRCTSPITPMKPRPEHNAALALEEAAPDDDVEWAGLVLEGQEHHAGGRARPLAAFDEGPVVKPRRQIIFNLCGCFPPACAEKVSAGVIHALSTDEDLLSIEVAPPFKDRDRGTDKWVSARF